MTITVSRSAFFQAIEATASLTTLYTAVSALPTDNTVYIQFNTGASVEEGDALAVFTQSTYAWTDTQMSTLFVLATSFGDSPSSVDKLGIYNKALRHLGERKLALLTENREARRYLDDEYVGVISLCLRGGLWNFAMRAIQIDAAGSITPSFGYQGAFPKPHDWIRTSLLSTNETFDPPLRYYQDQDGYWLCNADTLYVRYVSSSLGFNLAVWPTDFAEYVAISLARTIAPRITQNDNLAAAIEAKEEKFRKRAQANDAMDQPPTPWPMGTWTTSRIRRGVLPGLSNNIRYW